MQSYKHFTLNDREFLYEKLNQNWSIRKIADAMGRSPSSVCREIKRNRSKIPKHEKRNNYNYHFWRAEILTKLRRKKKSYRAINENSELWNYVIDKLNIYWSPEQITTTWRIIHPDSTISTNTVYRYIKDGRFGVIKPKTHLRRRGKNYRLVRHNSQAIHPDRIIPEWTECIKNRARTGDWEGDTIYGGVGKGLLVTLVDRKSRFLCAGLLSGKNSHETKEKIIQLLKNMPVYSISLDNGSEFSEFREIEERLETLVYFAEPHKPWQRGINENTNDILRFFFPKGCDSRGITDEDVQKVVDMINNRPRKCLGWKTPYEVFYGVALT